MPRSNLRQKAPGKKAKAGERGTCHLCSLPLPRHPVQSEERGPVRFFCCAGCLHVSAIVRSLGEGSPEARRLIDRCRVRALISQSGTPARGPSPGPTQREPAGAGLEGCAPEAPRPLAPDTAAAPRLDTTPAGRSDTAGAPGLDTTGAPRPDADERSLNTERFALGGLMCPSCAWLVEEVLRGEAGVRHAEVEFLTDTCRVTFDLRETSAEKLASAIAPWGYRLSPLVGEGPEARRARIISMARLGVATLATANVCCLSYVHYADYLLGAQGTALAASRGIALIELILTLPVVAWSAWPIHMRAWAFARRGRLGMDSLISLGVLASFFISLVGFLGTHTFFFETACFIVFAALLGRALEGSLKAKAARELGRFINLAPAKARCINTDTDTDIDSDGEPPRYLPANEVAAGTRIEVLPEEVVPLDVRTAGERVVVSEALLTGEPIGMEKSPGSVVLAGSRLLSGRITGDVLRPLDQAFVAQAGRRIAEALRSGEARLRSADRIAQAFVPVVVAVAVIAWLGHAWAGGDLWAIKSWLPAVSVLVVACPCAFGIAASAAIAASVAALARRGVLAKDAASLERLARIDTICLDKTGIITLGDYRLKVVRWLGQPEEELLRDVAAVEAYSEHPVALTLRGLDRREGRSGSPGRSEATDASADVPAARGSRGNDEATEITVTLDGIEGRVAGRVVRVGSLGFFGLSTYPQAVLHEDRSSADTIVFFGRGSSPIGYCVLGDSMRPGAVQAIGRLKELGHRLILLSGDRREAVAAYADQLGIGEYRAAFSPQAKEAFVDALCESGSRVTFVGDGLNDALALARADVGISLKHGSDLSVMAAPFVLLREDLLAAVELIRRARRTRRVVAQNYALASIYNAFFIPVAALGGLVPLHAAILMALSSIGVTVNSLRLRATREKEEPAHG